MGCAQLTHLEDIPQCVENFLAQEVMCNVAEERRLDVKLCLFELLSNAFTHNDPMPDGSACVLLSWTFEEDGVFIEIDLDKSMCRLTDGPKKICQLDESYLLDEHGRGLFLVASVAEFFQHTEDFRYLSLKVKW